MKKIFLIICFLFTSVNCFAGAATMGVLGSGVVGSSGGCSGTYGNDNISGYSSTAAAGPGHIRLGRVELSCSGDIATVSSYLSGYSTSGDEYILLVYTDNAGVPADKLYEGSATFDAGEPGTGAWVSDTGLSVSISGDPTYIWVGAQYESTNVNYWRVGSMTGQGFYTNNYNFGSAPATGITGTASSFTINAYVTF